VHNAQEDCCHHQEHQRHDQILVEAFVQVFFKKYMQFLSWCIFIYKKHRFFCLFFIKTWFSHEWHVTALFPQFKLIRKI
jgi:hypothetical protein